MKIDLEVNSFFSSHMVINQMIQMERQPEPSRRGRSFFRFLIGDFAEQLQIPTSFVKHFGGVLPQDFILRSPARRSTHVNVKKVSDKLFLGEGWSLFVQDNSLEFGDFLVFEYAGNSTLNVMIFEKSGCEKQFSLATGNRSDVIYIDSYCTHQEVGVTSLGDQFRDKENRTFQGKSKQLGCKEGRMCLSVKRVKPKSSCSRVSKAMQGKATTLEAASSFVSKHFFFKYVMKKSYLRRGTLSLAQSFVKRYVKGSPQIITLQISKRSWPVKVLTYENQKSKLSAGWPAFVKDNALLEGDVCVFELINRSVVVLEVHIFRCAG